MGIRLQCTCDDCGTAAVVPGKESRDYDYVDDYDELFPIGFPDGWELYEGEKLLCPDCWEATRGEREAAEEARERDRAAWGAARYYNPSREADRIRAFLDMHRHLGPLEPEFGGDNSINA